jgi:hypothetical protein
MLGEVVYVRLEVIGTVVRLNSTLRKPLLRCDRSLRAEYSRYFSGRQPGGAVTFYGKRFQGGSIEIRAERSPEGFRCINWDIQTGHKQIIVQSLDLARSSDSFSQGAPGLSEKIRRLKDLDVERPGRGQNK